MIKLIKVYKIKNRNTNQFASKGGSSYGTWTKLGTTWSHIGHCKNHINGCSKLRKKDYALNADIIEISDEGIKVAMSCKEWIVKKLQEEIAHFSQFPESRFSQSRIFDAQQLLNELNGVSD